MIARIVCFLFSLISCARADNDATAFKLLVEKHSLEKSAITEASGLAISPTNPNFMWVVNDSGGTPAVHLARTDGSYRGKVTLKNAMNIDWEDLASFVMDGKTYLLVADTGDNDSKRKSCILHIFREPELPADGKSLDVTVSAERAITFQYEGGPRDCESVAVDITTEKILLISKRTQPPQVHELPLRPKGKSDVLTARNIGPTAMTCPVPSFVPYQNQPTGLDISADGRLAAAITYYGVFLFPRAEGEAWTDAFAKKPIALAAHHLGQAESIAISKNGRSIYAVAEGKISPIRIYQR